MEKTSLRSCRNGGNIMRKLLFNVEEKTCDECALAFRRFIGHISGIESVDCENRKIAIVFDNAKMTHEELIRLTIRTALRNWAIS